MVMRIVDKIKSLFKSKEEITWESLCYIAKCFDLKVSYTTSYIAIRKIGICKNIATLDLSLKTLQVEKSLFSKEEVEKLCKKYEVHSRKLRNKNYLAIDICNMDDLTDILKLILSK